MAVTTDFPALRGSLSLVWRVLAALVAVPLLAAAAWSLARQPFALSAALALVCCLSMVRWPHGWLFFIPMLLPVVDLTTLTGDLLVTDSDGLLLASAGVGYGLLALVGARRPLAAPEAVRVSPFVVILLVLLTASYVVGTLQGFLPYAPLEEQMGGYHNRWNSLRVAKGYFLALVFLPLLIRAIRQQGEPAIKHLMAGMLAGLAGVCLFGLYERLAFTGLTNLSSDYRITASFWEMHVGGAALDGWLAFTLPCALWAVLRGKRPVLMVPLTLLALLAGYICLVTFSRGLYGACLLILILVLLFERRTVLAWAGGEEPAPGAATAKPAKGLGLALSLLLWLALPVLFWCTWTVFHTAGYRGLLAFILLVPAGHLSASLARRGGLVGLAVAAVVMLLGGALALGLHMATDKGAYLAFAVLALSFVVLAVAGLKQRSPVLAGATVGLWAAMMLAGCLVALHWGNEPALWDFVRADGVLLAGVILFGLIHRGEWQPRSSVMLLGLLGVMSLGAVMSSSYYIGTRFSTSGQDLGGRSNHWRESLGRLQSTGDWLLGRGIGRFPDEFYWSTLKYQGTGLFGESLAPGLFAVAGGEKGYLRLFSARHPADWGEYLRVMQAVNTGGRGPLVVMADVRAPKDVRLYFEVCERHLIYAENCSNQAVAVKHGDWQAIQTTIPVGDNGGPWFAPRRSWFAVALESRGETVEVSNLRLMTAAGDNLLKNGSFTDNGRYWFFSSDRDHLPWHIKNLLLNMLFDQGLLGLIAFALFWLGALVRMLARTGFWPMAPYFVASLVGFLVVGLFDSLLDVPRLATLFYLCSFAMLLVRPERFAKATAKPS